ncbi:hypothetical protein VTL71DRAFT_9094 [Oculimacula yallundae]|uniref:Uncharacterized protein n=1 Tax=Oculimacula yallundae TaxID=86028 RepID=A0ABR4BTR4_9HELO
MQFIAILAVFFTAVAAVPVGSSVDMLEARDVGVAVAERAIAEASTPDMLEARDIGVAVAERAIAEASAADADVLEARGAGTTACHGACQVTCNSTVLALMQKKCLAKCYKMCPNKA